LVSVIHIINSILDLYASLASGNMTMHYALHQTTDTHRWKFTD